MQDLSLFKSEPLPDQADGLTAVDARVPQPGQSAIAAPGEISSKSADGIFEDAYKECQERLSALFEGVETGIFIIDPETHELVDANSVAAKMVGVPRDRIVGSLCHKFVCPADKGRCPVTDLGQTVDNSERILLTASGERRAIIKTVRPVVVGGRKQLLESFLDITERKHAETALKERTAYLHSLIDVSPLGIVVLDAERRVEIANAAFEHLFLCSRTEAKGANLTDLIVPEALRVEAADLAQRCLDQGSVQTTTRRQRKDGTLVDVRLFAAPLTIDGNACGFLSLYEDISAQIQAEKQMAERHRLADLAAKVGAALTAADSLRQGLQSCTEILARNMDVAFARVWTLNDRENVLELQASAGQYTHIDGAHARVPIGNLKIGRIAENGEPHLSNNVLEDPWVADRAWARREGMVAFAGYPLKIRGRVLGVAAAFARVPLTDATLQTFASVADSIALFIERKHAEESLRESEDRFRKAFEDAPYGMCMTTPDGHFMHANGALCAMLGYSAEELQSGAWQELTHPDDMERSRQAAIELNRGSCPVYELEKRYIHKNGGIVWVRIKILPVRRDNREISHFVTQIEDTTSRKQADEAQAFLVSLVDSTPDAIVGMTLDGNVVSWNQGAGDLLGFSAAKAIGMPVSQFILPERQGEAPGIFARLRRGEQIDRYETALMRKDGTRVSVSMTLSPVRDTGGHVTGIAVIAHDITQRKRREQQTQLQTAALESAANGILIADSLGAIQWANPAFTRLTGYSAEEVMGQNPRVLKSGNHSEAFYNDLWTTVLRGDTWHGELVNRRKDGTLYDEEMTITPVRATDGTIQHFVAIKQDITERKRAQEELSFKTALLEIEAETTIDAILVVDRAGRRVQSNRRFAEIFNIPSELLVSQDDPRILAQMRSLLQSPDSFFESVQYLYAHESATLRDEVQLNDGRYLDRYAAPLNGPNGEYYGRVIYFRDITERKRAEEELRFKTTLLETEAETTIDGILVVDRNGKWLQTNRRFAEIFNYSAEFLEHCDDQKMLHWVRSEVCNPEAFLERIQYLYEHESAKARDEIQLRDGRIIDRYSAPLQDANGKLYGRVSYFRDITDRKRYETELKSKTALLEAQANSTIDGMLVVDSNLRRVLINRRLIEMYEIPEALLTNPDQIPLREYLISRFRDREAAHAMVNHLYSHPEEADRREFEMTNGTVLDVYSAPVKGPAREYFGRVWTYRDITARKRAEQAIRENEQRYRELFENASEVIFTTDLEGRFTSLNRAGQEDLGYSQDEAAQTDIWQVVVPAFHERLKQELGQMLAGETPLTSEIEAVAKDGRRIKLEVKPRLIWHGGHPIGVQAVARDITGRDIAEMEVRQAQKLEAVGRLASGIAHEINTPIQFVGDNTRFLKDSFASLKSLLGKFGQLRDAASSGTVSPEFLGEVRRAEEESDCAYLLDEIPRAISQTMEGVERVATIVRAMKEFAHPESKEMAPADLNKALQSTITVARNEWKYVAEVETRFADLPLVVCNVGDLNQVFLNLLVNAAHAIGDVVKNGGKGRIVIQTAAEAERVHISIADTGAGIPEGIRTKIYDPFFTTKEVGRGTGQGLAIARSVIVDRHKGTLNFESEVGKGTTFHIRLPVSLEETATEAKGR